MLSSQVVCRGLIITGLSLFLLVGCQSRTNRGLSDEENAASSDSALPLDLHASTQQSTWETLLLETGEEGQDYDPHTILVAYQRKSTTSITGGNGLTTTTPRDTGGSSSVISLADNEDMAALTDSIERALGITARREIYVGEVNLASFAVPADQDSSEILQRLRSEFADRIAYAVFDPIRHADYLPNDPDIQTGAAGELWSHFQIGCPDAWDITMGDSDVIVAVVDTGARLNHDELTVTVINPLVEYPTAYCDVVNNDKSIEDADGHGTFISGVIAAEANNGLAIAGVAPDCRVLPIKVSNDGEAYTSDVIAGCLLAQQLGADVINLSFGGDTSIPAEEQMVNQVTAAGCLFVTSAGNDGVSTLSYPAAFAKALAVGSTGYYDSRTVFSNWGSYVDIAAPGIDLKSCSHTGDNAYEYNGQGTSYSAPMVAAAAALLWSYKPELTNVDVKNLLESTGMPTTGFTPIPPVNRLDIGNALSSIQEVVVPAISGVNVNENMVVGSAPGITMLPVSISGPIDVTSVTYTLDITPLYTIDESDPTVSTTSGETFSSSLPLPLDEPNQFARLVVEYFSSSGHAGPEREVSICLFNQLGEVDGDHVVTLEDLDAISALIGLARGDEDFNPFCDSNCDGVISEGDIAAVGYFWGDGAVIPDITGVEFTEGTQGTPITFRPNCIGTSPVDFAWAFGEACDPSTSNEQEPTVLLGLPGDHQLTVTATNSWGSDEYSFYMHIGPPEGDPPVISSIYFINTSEFVHTNVHAIFTGTPPFTYAWDFDGCGNPSTSDEPRPEIQLNGIGVYPVSLTVTNLLGSDTYNTEVTITGKPDPIAAIDTSTLFGSPPLDITFYADRSSVIFGSIEQYDWSWDGDEVFEATSTEPEISHIFTELGIHTVRLRVTDEIGKTGDATIDIEVKDLVAGDWVFYEIADSGDYTNGHYKEIRDALIDERPALLCRNLTDLVIELFHATVTHPTSAEQWERSTILEMEDTDDLNYLSLIEVNNQPAMMMQDSHCNIYYLCKNGAVWEEHLVLDGNDESWLNPEMINVAGKPAFITGVYLNNHWNIKYCRATTASPGSQDDWVLTDLYLHEEGGEFKHYTGMLHPVTVVDNKPIYTFDTVIDYNSSRRWMMHALVSEPTGPADWLKYEMWVDPDRFGGGGLLHNINGKPVLYHGDYSTPEVRDVSHLHMASIAAPTIASDWTVTRPGGESSRFHDIAADVDKPIVSWWRWDDGAELFYVATATSAMPSDDSDWDVIELVTPYDEMARLLTTSNGSPAMFFMDPYAAKLYYYYPMQ